MKKILQSCILVAMLLLVMRGEAQQRTVSGIVTSQDDGRPLAGVSVLIEGATTGTITDVLGKYSLKVPSGTHQLMFTHQGYVSQTVPASSDLVDISLAPDVKQLTDVVVTALGIKRSEKSLTYSAQVVDGSSLDVAKETNVVNSLQGKVSGVVISRSATGPRSPGWAAIGAARAPCSATWIGSTTCWRCARSWTPPT